MKKGIAMLLAVLLLLALCPLTACAEETEPIDEVKAAELSRAVFEANRLDAVFSRHRSMTVSTEFPDDPARSTFVWETADEVYTEYGAEMAEWFRDGFAYRIARDEETGVSRLSCGPNVSPTYDPWYCLVGDSFEKFNDPEHDRLTETFERDGLIHVLSEYDETLARQELENAGIAYMGQRVTSETIMDRENLDILRYAEYVEQDGGREPLEVVTLKYDMPEPVAKRSLLAAFELDTGSNVELRFAVDPGTDRAFEKTATVPVGIEPVVFYEDTSYLSFGDADCETLPNWDGKSDYTWYIFTDPGKELLEKYNALWFATEDGRAYGKQMMERLVEVTGEAAVLENHSSAYYRIEKNYEPDFAVYYDRDGRYYIEGPVENKLNLNGEIWAVSNSDGEERTAHRIFYAMNPEEAEARIAEDFDVSLFDSSTVDETVKSVTENDDGTITVTTMLSAEEFAARCERTGYVYPEELAGLPQECVYTLDAQTAELLWAEDYLLHGEEKILISVIKPEYDGAYPAGLEELLALREQYQTDDPEREKTVTVVYDAGTEAEQRFSIEVNAELQVWPVLREGYVGLSIERTERPDGSGYSAVTLYAAPVEAA